jgi:capsular exopolysaccharide synthesis family protein
MGRTEANAGGSAVLELTSPERPASMLQELVEGPTNLVAVLWRRRRLVSACVLSCLGLAAIYLLYAPRLYQATARLLVVQQGGRPLNMVASDQSRVAEVVEDIIPTQMIVVASPLVVGRAMRTIGLNELVSLEPSRGFDRCLRQATKNLFVTRPDRLAKILQVEYRARTPAEATRMVQAILESYKTFLEDVYQKNNSEVIVLMTRARDDLNRELKDLERKYLEFHQKSPNLTTDGTGRPIVLRRVDDWVRASNESMVKAIQLKAELELGRDLAKQGVGLWAISGAMDQLGQQVGGSLSARTQTLTPVPPWDYLRQLNQEEQQLAVRFGPQNTRVRAIQEQIAEVQEHTRSVRGRIEQAEIHDLLESTERTLTSIEAMRREIAEQFDRDLGIAKRAEIDLLTETNLRSNLDRQRLLFNTVVDQLKQARLVGDFSSIRSQIIEPAGALPQPVRPLVALTLALALAVGGALGVGCALVSELLDPRVRSLEEMRKVIDFPVLGQVPQLVESSLAGARPIGLVSHIMPRSPSAEAFKVVRANLDCSRRNQEARVLMVTSPRAGEGKTAVASNLAICLAQVGRRVLLVDADLRRPMQHEIHGLRRECGLVQILREVMSLDRVVQATPVRNLEVVTSGPEVPNPAELLSVPALAEFFQRASTGYDTVIVDAPPLLAVADPAIIGALVDAVLLVVRVADTRRDDAARAVELLKGLGTPVVGGVINGVGPEPVTAPWVLCRRVGSVTDRHVREIRIDSQLIFVPGVDFGTLPAASTSQLHGPSSAIEDRS